MTLLEVERAPHLEYPDYLGGYGLNFSVCMHMCVSSAVSSGEIRLPRETSNVSCLQKGVEIQSCVLLSYSLYSRCPIGQCLTLCIHGVL